MPRSRTSYKNCISRQNETKQGFFSSTYTCVSTDTEVSIHPQKTSVNLKPVKTLLKKFRLFPNMVAFLTVANIVQMFELHASKQFSPPYAMERNSGLFRFCGFNVASQTVANR